MRVAVEEVARQSDHVDQPLRFALGFAAASPWIHRLGQERPHGLARAQRADRVLKHHRDVAAHDAPAGTRAGRRHRDPENGSSR